MHCIGLPEERAYQRWEWNFSEKIKKIMGNLVMQGQAEANNYDVAVLA